LTNLCDADAAPGPDADAAPGPDAGPNASPDAGPSYSPVYFGRPHGLGSLSLPKNKLPALPKQPFL